MLDQAAANTGRIGHNIEELVISADDRSILRDLAATTAEIAARDEQSTKRKKWQKHNDLEENQPMVFCDPEIGWREIITKNEMKCKGVLAREWEYRLRREIFWGNEMGDDKVIEPYFKISPIYAMSGWGMQSSKRYTAAEGGSYNWTSPLGDYSLLDIITAPKIQVDYPATKLIFETAADTFDGLLTVQRGAYWWWTLGLTSSAIQLRGLEQFMFDMYDYPNELHRLMKLLSDGTLKAVDFLEENGLLDTNIDSYVGSGGFGYTSQLNSTGSLPAKTAQMWGFGESQETSGVSSKMFEEFVFPYQRPLLEKFGLNCYGCCEALNSRWDTVKNIPRLRRVSVSPWADLKDMAEKLQNKYICSLKPNPAYLAAKNIDKDFIRKNIKQSLQTLKGCEVEIILKDTTTIGKNPKNVSDWCKIAREEIVNSTR